MRTILPAHVLSILFIAFAACSSSNLSESSYEGAGRVIAQVSGTKSFNPKISHGRIVEYLLTVSGEAIGEPIVASIGGDASSATFEAIPAGLYKIECSAINENGVKIRAGSSKDVVVTSGEVTEAAIEMEAVPVFANLTKGAVIANTRFFPEIFAGSAEPIELEDEFNGVRLPMMDLSTSSGEIYPDASSGMAAAKFGLLPAGFHVFRVRNLVNGMESEVEVTLLDGSKFTAAPLFTGGDERTVLGGIK